MCLHRGYLKTSVLGGIPSPPWAVDPGPCGPDHVADIAVAGHPVERFGGMGGVGEKLRRVSFPPGAVSDRNFAPGDFLRGFDDLLYGDTHARSQIAPYGIATVRKVIECFGVSHGQIDHVDI